MKTALILVACLGLLAGCSSAPEPETDPATENLDLMSYEVFGMDCPGCHGGLENLAMAIPGVKSAQASWEDKKLTLGIEEGAEVTEEQVHDAIERANFTAGEKLK